MPLMRLHPIRPVDPLRGLLALVAVIACGTSVAEVAGPDPALAPVCSQYERSEALIAMRDGVRLYTQIYRRKDAQGPQGILLTRTPYEQIPAGQICSHRLLSYFEGVRDDPYIIVIQSIRGRYKSEGTFVLLPEPAPPGSPRGVDQTTDAWDTVDWLVHHIPGNNGKVALLGVSYDGWLALMAALDPHPAVATVSVQGSRMDQWIGDDFWRNGALRLDYAFEYAAFMELSHEQEPFAFDADDMYEWYLNLGSIGNVNANYFHGRSEFWNQLERHQTHDEFWQPRTPPARLGAVTIPVLVTAGWWDAEDFYGSLHVFKGLTGTGTTPNSSRLVIGPWTHGSWIKPPGRSLGKLDFGSDTSAYWVEQVERPWLAHWVLGRPSPNSPGVLSFRTGSNRWMRYDHWPPRPEHGNLTLYLGCDSRITPGKPVERRPCRRSYVSSPADPLPYLPRPVGPIHPGKDFGGSEYHAPWPTWEVQDQRFSTHRPDTFVFATEPLEQEITVTGEATLTLHVTTTGTDGDFIVKLLDIYPSLIPRQPELGGYHLMLDHSVLAARYRDSLTDPKPLIPGRVYELTFHFTGSDHTFLTGHRIAIQLQSTLFPVIARNPQSFVENLFAVRDSDFKTARIDVVFDPERPTVLTLPRN